MSFDAREAKLLEPGQHFTISECSGLRLEASAAARLWIYRFKSPVDQRMRQVKIGASPKMSLAAATVEWKKLSDIRAEGRDPATERQQKEAQALAREQAERRLTVMMYLERRGDRNRKEKGTAEARRTLTRVLVDHLKLAEMNPAAVTGAISFSILEHYLDTLVQTGKLCVDLGATWDYGHDSGKLDEEVPNWRRQIMRGKLQQQGTCA